MKKIVVIFGIVLFFFFEAWNDYSWDSRYIEKLPQDWEIFSKQTNAIDPMYFYQFFKQPVHRLGLLQKKSITILSNNVFKYQKRWVDRNWNKQITSEDFISFIDCSRNLEGNLRDKNSEINLNNIEWKNYLDNPYISSAEDKQRLVEQFSKICSILNSSITQRQNIVIPVSELPIKYGSEVPINKIVPKTIEVTTSSVFGNQLSAYYATNYQTLIGPKNWLGKAIEGANGSLDIELYPPGGSVKSGPNITFYDVPVCWSCFLYSSSQYWDSAAKMLVDGNLGQPQKQIPGLKITTVTPGLVRFIRPNTIDGLEINGVAYVKMKNNKIEPPFKEFTVTLPKEQHGLAMELLNIFINRIPK